MVHGIEDKQKKKNPLMNDKDYILEAWLQGGKAIGSLCSRDNKRKKQSKNEK